MALKSSLYKEGNLTVLIGATFNRETLCKRLFILTPSVSGIQNELHPFQDNLRILHPFKSPLFHSCLDGVLGLLGFRRGVILEEEFPDIKLLKEQLP